MEETEKTPEQMLADILLHSADLALAVRAGKALIGAFGAQKREPGISGEQARVLLTGVKARLLEIARHRMTPPEVKVSALELLA